MPTYSQPTFEEQVAAIANPAPGSLAQPPPGPAPAPGPQPLNTGGLSLGAGLTMPTEGNPTPVGAPSGATAPKAAPMARSADLAYNDNLRDATIMRSDPQFMRATDRDAEERRLGLVRELRAAGASTNAASKEATSIDRSDGRHAAGVPNPNAAGAGAGGAGAPPFDQVKAGYEAQGINPNDPRQAKANAAASRESEASAKLAAEQAQQAEMAGNNLVAFHQGQAKEMARAADEEAAKRREASDLAAPHLARYQALQSDLASQKIDPDLIYRGAAGGVRRVTSALGVALGAIGAVYGKTDNFAQKIVDQQINRSVEAQRDNLANKRAVAESEKGVYTMLREQGADDATARAAQRALGYQAAAQTAEGIAANITNQATRRQADMQAQQLRQQGAAAEVELTRAANKSGYEQAEARRREAIAAEAKLHAGDAAVAATEKAEAPATAASQALHEEIDQTGGVAGYGLAGRLGRALLPEAIGTSEQGRANMRSLDRLAAGEAKDEQGRVNPEMKADILRTVHNEDDVRRFLLESDYRHKVAREAARRTKGLGVGGGPSRTAGETD